jgi:hypothetical protein
MKEELDNYKIDLGAWSVSVSSMMINVKYAYIKSRS